MHEIKVLPIKLSWSKGKYYDLNREPTVPHTVALPIELYYPNIILNNTHKNIKFYNLFIMLEWFEHSIINTKNLWLTL